MLEHFLQRSSDLKVVESGVRNKFKWTWLEEKDANNDFLSEIDIFFFSIMRNSTSQEYVQW